MKRMLCLWLPHWSLQCLGVAQPHLRDRAVVLRGRGPRGGEIVVDCSAAAWRRGIRVGMPLAEALALGQITSTGKTRAERNQSEPLEVEERSVEADREALSRLAQWCERFSPLVGWELPDVSAGGGPTDAGSRARGPENVFLEITGLGMLFGGEAALVHQLLAALTAQGYYARVAVADTLGAAYALAHYALTPGALTPGALTPGALTPGALTPGALTPGAPAAGIETLWQATARGPRAAAWLAAPGRVREALTSLPVAALRLPVETTRWLDELGIERIGQLLSLPRASLRDRLGEVLLRRLDQALGTAPEAWVAHRPPPEFRAARTLEFALERRESVEFVARELLTEVAAALRSRGVGALQLFCRFDSSDGAPVNIQLNLFQPTASSTHLFELIRLRLEQLVFPGPVGRLLVEVGQTARLQEEQTELFPVSGRVLPREVTGLIDRLSSRLGSTGVVQPRLQADAQPERAFRYTPWNQLPSPRRQRAASVPLPHALARPLSVFVPAQPLEILAVVPAGPPLRFREGGRDRHIARYWGPERVETGWWRGRSVRRDYYRVETHSGQRFWLYRRLEDGRWFLQGTFE